MICRNGSLLLGSRYMQLKLARFDKLISTATNCVRRASAIGAILKNGGHFDF
jgi:hypothetical protein